MGVQNYYPTDLTDDQWQLIKAFFPKSRGVVGGPGRSAPDDQGPAVGDPNEVPRAKAAQRVWLREYGVRLFQSWA